MPVRALRRSATLSGRLERLTPPADLAELVRDSEFARLLGYPTSRIPPGPVLRRADQARDWYRRRGDPWALARVVAIERLSGPEILLADGGRWTSDRLARSLEEAAAPAVAIVAVSAGSRIDRRSQRLWREERPDEAYCLDRFGAAVTEHLGGWIGHELRRKAPAGHLAAMPGYGPGYDGWDLAQQPLVAASLLGAGDGPPAVSLRVLPSGMLRPRSSLLLVSVLTPDTELADRSWAHHRCSWCALAGCALRRGRVALDGRRD